MPLHYKMPANHGRAQRGTTVNINASATAACARAKQICHHDTNLQVILRHQQGIVGSSSL